MVYYGIPVSPGIAKSKAKIINDLDDFSKVENGDIIVVDKSFPGWIVPLMKASGMICEIGGNFSHIAILCRELGKPCVSGVSDIRSTIKDGENVLIDGNKGEIHVE